MPFYNLQTRRENVFKKVGKGWELKKILLPQALFR